MSSHVSMMRGSIPSSTPHVYMVAINNINILYFFHSFSRTTPLGGSPKGAAGGARRKDVIVISFP